MPLAVASRYARALVDLAMDPSSGLDPQIALEKLRLFEALLEDSADLRNLLMSPAVSMADKRAVLTRLGGLLGMPHMLRNFLCVLAEHHRIGIVKEARSAFEQMLDERRGVARADVTSARGLTGEQRARLEAELARLAGRRVRCEFSVDNNLIGGAVARIGSTVYDGSVRGQLAEMRRRLAQ
jgi:F-type H+-transporting ATPase subunit delta